MEWNYDIDLDKRKFTSRLIVERTLARGWKIAGFKTNPAIFLVYVPGRDKPVKIFSASPPQMPYPASKIAKDKFITNQLLGQENLPVPHELLLDIDEPLSDEVLSTFLTQNQRVVVKPLDASHGKGITVDITSVEQLTRAIDEAKRHTEKSIILVQQQIEGIDIRIVCIDYQFVDAISRIPASVVGDGQHTIKELIEITNASDERGENYKARLNVIPLDRATEYLGTERMVTVPAVREEVQVIGVSNVGMGGVRHNIKHDIPEFLKDYAIQAAKALELPVCGVDFMVRRLPKVTDTAEDLSPSIIEANECPMLTMYDDLTSDEQSAVIDRYLDYIARA